MVRSRSKQESHVWELHLLQSPLHSLGLCGTGNATDDTTASQVALLKAELKF